MSDDALSATDAAFFVPSQIMSLLRIYVVEIGCDPLFWEGVRFQCKCAFSLVRSMNGRVRKNSAGLDRGLRTELRSVLKLMGVSDQHMRYRSN